MCLDTDETFPMTMAMLNWIDRDFAAATLLISFRVAIGRASPLQMLVMMLSQVINKVVFCF